MWDLQGISCFHRSPRSVHGIRDGQRASGHGFGEEGERALRRQENLAALASTAFESRVKVVVRGPPDLKMDPFPSHRVFQGLGLNWESPQESDTDSEGHRNSPGQRGHTAEGWVKRTFSLGRSRSFEAPVRLLRLQKVTNLLLLPSPLDAKCLAGVPKTVDSPVQVKYSRPDRLKRHLGRRPVQVK
jgi:hypothetical protein